MLCFLFAYRNKFVYKPSIMLKSPYSSESNIFPISVHFSAEVAAGSQPWNWLT